MSAPLTREQISRLCDGHGVELVPLDDRRGRRTDILLAAGLGLAVGFFWGSGLAAGALWLIRQVLG